MIKIIDEASGQVLFTFSNEESSDAYQKAAELELLNLDVKIETEGIIRQLAKKLGQTNLELLDRELERETEDHN